MALTVTLPVVGRTAPGAGREEVIAHIRRGARLIRMKDLANVVNAGQGHIGGELSVTDILATLYLHVANISPDNLDDPDRDRVILSKGHAANALYCTFAAAGLLDPAALDTFVQPGSPLNGHPACTKVRGVEASTGPLGHGLPIAVGDAIAAKIDGSSRRVFVITGDGELQEGSNWEALMCAAQYGLDNLVVITDRNRLQQGASTEDTNGLSPLEDKARAFGAHVVEVDAHDHGQLLDALQVPAQPGTPTYIIAHSHKGHPVSFMSDKQPWHHKLPSPEEAQAALAELEALA